MKKAPSDFATRALRKKSAIFSSVVLLLAFAVPFITTLVLSSSVRSNDEEHNRQTFALTVKDEEAKFVEHLESYKGALRSTSGLFSASGELTQEEFRTFISALNLESSLPGANGVGYTEIVDPNEVDTFKAEVIEDGAPDFTIKQLAQSNESLYILKFIEPREPNSKAIGINSASEINRKTAAETARDTGEPTISKEISLAQDDDKNPAFAIFHPIYEQGASVETVADRQSAITGWIATTTYANNFFDELLSSSRNEVTVEVLQGSATAEPNSVFNSRQDEQHVPKYTKTNTVNFLNDEWTFEYASTKEFESSVETGTPSKILFAGIAASLLFLFIAFLFVRRTAVINGQVQAKTKELKENENRLELALAGTNDGVWDQMDVENDEEFWSPKFYELLGYTNGEIESKASVFDRFLIHPDDAEKCREILSKAIEDIDTFDTEYRLKTKTRGYRWFRGTGSVSMDADTNIKRMAGTISDVHELVITREKLKTNEERLALAVKGTQVGLFDLFDVKTGEGYLSPQFFEMLGYENLEFDPTATSFISLLHPDDRAHAIETVIEATKSTTAFDLEYRLKTKSGGYCWVQAKGIVTRDPATKIKRITGSISDISARKDVERIKNEFVSVVSHELRTPLTSIRGSLGLLAGMKSELPPEKVDKMLKIAYENSERLVAIVNDILDIDKISLGKMDFDMHNEMISTMVYQAIESTRSLADVAGIELVAEVDQDDIVAKVDEKRLVQVVVNLLSNAIKFSPRDSTVKVKVTGDNSVATISVEDFGAGVPVEFRKDIFGKFSQADGSSSRKQGGSGLGLFICKKFVEQMDGEIGFEAKDSGGSIFWIKFPRVVAEERASVKKIERTAVNATQSDIETGATLS
jgi:PAS domain S-box-containing protein